MGFVHAAPTLSKRHWGLCCKAMEIAVTWLLMPAAWSQFAILVVVYLAAVVLARAHANR